MSYLLGYRSTKVAMTGSALEVISSGTPVIALTFVNETGSSATFSGSQLQTTDVEQGFVIEVPANDSITLGSDFYCADGANFTAPAGTSVSYFYSSTR